MSAWQEYKKRVGNTKPWHLLSQSNHTTKEIAENRYKICLECPELIKLTGQCKQCGCVMSLKVKLTVAQCPLGKW